MRLMKFVIGVAVVSCWLTSGAQSDTISHWPMNGTGTANVGDTVADAVGSNDGVVVNEALEYVAGPFAGSPSALQFQQDTQDKIDVPDDASLHFNLDEDDFTMEAVFRVAADATGRPSPFAKNGSAAADSQYWSRVRADQTGGVQFLLRGDAGDGPGGDLPPERAGTTSASVTDGRWHHFAAVFEAGDTEVKLYVDHVLDTTFAVDPTDGIIGDNADGLILGGFTSSSREFGGEIADIRISNMALSADQFLGYIPEPGSLALALVALVGLGAVRRRR